MLWVKSIISKITRFTVRFRKAKKKKNHQRHKRNWWQRLNYVRRHTLVMERRNRCFWHCDGIYVCEHFSKRLLNKKKVDTKAINYYDYICWVRCGCCCCCCCFFFHDKHGFKLFYLLLRLLLIIYRNDYCLMEVKEVTRDEPRVERITAMKFKPKSNVRNRSLVWIP